MIGQVLDDRYRIVDVLGRGGIGVVYRAQQLQVHGRDVAIKVLSAGASARVSTAHRFENEARIIAQLRHPNTLKLFDTGRTPDGRLYIVTECLRGVPLSERLADGPLTALETVTLLGQVADALMEAHENGIIHRDLKPPNVFLEKVGSQEVVKVLDFGIAKLVDGARITSPRQIFGTPGFMAPEQCLGVEIDARADLYALGVLGYVCLSCQLPIDGGAVEEIVAKTIELPPKPLRDQPGLEYLEPELEGLIMQLLAKTPSDRLPDAQAVSEACARLVRTLSRTDAVALPSSSSHQVLPAIPVAPSRDLPRVEEQDPTELQAPADDLFDSSDDRPDSTRILPPSVSRPELAADPLDVANTVVPQGRGAEALAATTVNTRLTTEVAMASRSAPPRLGRNLALAVVSAIVAGGLAAGALYLLG